MNRRRPRLGIRAQLTLMLVLGALLSTAATLFIANNAIQQYALQQTRVQEQNNLKIALLVLQTQYGQNISISSEDKLVTDSPTAVGGANGFAGGSGADQCTGQYGKYCLNGDVNYVDQVYQLLGGFVSVYQCANPKGPTGQCDRVSTTLRVGNSSAPDAARQTNVPLESVPEQNMALNSSAPKEWFGVLDFSGNQFYTDYYPLLNPQQRLVGVLAVGVPLDTVTAFQHATTIQLLLLGLIVMIAGVIFALLFASSIASTLQAVARQVSSSAERIGALATQQSGGAQQQVWAVNSINRALQNFTATARDISRRADQLSQMGVQVMQKRAEISQKQVDSILAYMTRSAQEISQASHQEAQQYERMTSAMQAVIEIAEQVATGSEQATQSAQRLDEVVNDLAQVVGVQRLRSALGRNRAPEPEPDLSAMEAMSQPSLGSQASMGRDLVGAVRGLGSDASLGVGSQFMGRMPDAMVTGARPGNPRPGAMDQAQGAAGQMGQMGQFGGMGQMGQMPNGAQFGGSMGNMRPMAPGMFGSGPLRPGAVVDSDRLPPLDRGQAANPYPPQHQPGIPSGPFAPMDAGPFGARRSFGDGPEDFGQPGAGQYGPSRPDMSAPPQRTRGVRGPLSGPNPNFPNTMEGGYSGAPVQTGQSNGAPTKNRLPENMPDWLPQPPDNRSGWGRGE